MTGGALDRDSIGNLVTGNLAAGTPPLVESYISLDQQLQPNGFDLTLREAACLKSPGSMGQQPEDRELSSTETLTFDPAGWLQLGHGPHLIVFNEIVNLPLDLMALGRPRSSLLRSGVAIHTAVWDAGYRGRSQALLMVYHPQGFRVQRNARLMQLVFYPLTQQASQGYQGRFLGENL